MPSLFKRQYGVGVKTSHGSQTAQVWTRLQAVPGLTPQLYQLLGLDQDSSPGSDLSFTGLFSDVVSCGLAFHSSEEGDVCHVTALASLFHL